MKIVIIGGTGFLGKEIINFVNFRDDEFFVFTRTPEDKFSKFKNYPSNVKFISWDPNQVGEWKDNLEGVDIVINLVGASLASGIRWTKKVKKKLLDSRVIPTKTLVTAITDLEIKPKHFIQISGINYYNYSYEPIDENGLQANTYLGNLCKNWEEPSLLVKKEGIKTLIIRLAPVVSKNALLMKLLLLPYKLFAGGRYGLKGDQYFSWVHVDDFTSFIDFAIQKKLEGIVNLSSPNPIRNRDMNKIIGKVKKRPWFFHVPSFTLKIVLGEKSDLLLKSVNVVSNRLSEEGFSFKYENFEEALRHL